MEFTTNGFINRRAKVMTSSAVELQEFLDNNLAKPIIMTVRVFEKPTDLMFGYYWGKMVTEYQKGFKKFGERLTPEQTEYRMREMSTACHRINAITQAGPAIILKSLLEIEDLSRDEMIDYFEELKQIAAEHLSVYIADKDDLFKYQDHE